MKRPKIIDAEFTVVSGPERPKPWWRRIYLAKGWWIVAAMSAASAISAFSGHR